MNYTALLYVLAYTLQVEGLFFLLPLLTALIYGESVWSVYALMFIICLFIGYFLKKKKPHNLVFFTKDGLVMCGLSWLLISIVGAIPFVITGEIPSFIDALFETVSGFTTTGSTILTDVEALTHGSLMWRSFTHWIGGMGILVFVLSIFPMASSSNMYIMKAESPGPSVGKLVPRVKTTAQLLYLLYIVLTMIEMLLLVISGMHVFDAITLTFGTAGTGGFGVLNDSIASYSNLQQTIITIFMIAFGVNFNIYFLLYCKNFKDAFKSEELRVYLGVIFTAIVLISINTFSMFSSLYECVHHVAFTVGSIITTTGYATVDFDLWPMFSKGLLVLLMFVGACAGSTGGGLKISRIVILVKSSIRELSNTVHPRHVKQIRFEGKMVESAVVHSVERYLVMYLLVMIISIALVSICNSDFTTNFTAVAATLNNIGPGLNMVGPTCNFAHFDILSKIVLTFDMLAGRLELYPMLILCVPSLWEK